MPAQKPESMGQSHGQGGCPLLAIDDLGRPVSAGLRKEHDRTDERITPESQIRTVHQGHEVVDEQALNLYLAPAIGALV